MVEIEPSPESKTEVVEIEPSPEESKGGEVDNDEAEEAAERDEVAGEEDAVKPTAGTAATATEEPPEAESSEAAKSPDPEEPNKE